MDVDGATNEKSPEDYFTRSFVWLEEYPVNVANKTPVSSPSIKDEKTDQLEFNGGDQTQYKKPYECAHCGHKSFFFSRTYEHILEHIKSEMSENVLDSLPEEVTPRVVKNGSGLYELKYFKKQPTGISVSASSRRKKIFSPPAKITQRSLHGADAKNLVFKTNYRAIKPKPYIKTVRTSATSQVDLKPSKNVDVIPPEKPLKVYGPSKKSSLTSISPLINDYKLSSVPANSDPAIIFHSNSSIRHTNDMDTKNAIAISPALTDELKCAINTPKSFPLSTHNASNSITTTEDSQKSDVKNFCPSMNNPYKSSSAQNENQLNLNFTDINHLKNSAPKEINISNKIRNLNSKNNLVSPSKFVQEEIPSNDGTKNVLNSAPKKQKISKQSSSDENDGPIQFDDSNPFVEKVQKFGNSIKCDFLNNLQNSLTLNEINTKIERTLDTATKQEFFLDNEKLSSVAPQELTTEKHYGKNPSNLTARLLKTPGAVLNNPTTREYDSERSYMPAKLEVPEKQGSKLCGQIIDNVSKCRSPVSKISDVKNITYTRSLNTEISSVLEGTPKKPKINKIKLEYADIKTDLDPTETQISKVKEETQDSSKDSRKICLNSVSKKAHTRKNLSFENCIESRDTKKIIQAFKNTGISRKKPNIENDFDSSIMKDSKNDNSSKILNRVTSTDRISRTKNEISDEFCREGSEFKTPKSVTNFAGNKMADNVDILAENLNNSDVLLTIPKTETVLSNCETADNKIEYSFSADFPEIFVCYHCGYKTSTLDGLRRHILKVHFGEKVYVCRFCMYSAYTYRELKNHLITKHCSPKNRSCAGCFRKFSSWEKLNRHVLRTHINTKKSFKCIECDYSCGNERTLILHVLEKKHSDVRDRLTCHVKRSHCEKRYRCPLCTYASSTSDAVLTHKMSAHEGVKRYQCAHCQHSSLHLSHLREHIMYRHLKIKPFRCKECKYRCVSSGGLKKHFNSKHLKLRRYLCQCCDYASARADLLKNHILSRHLEHKFVCDRCGLSAPTKERLAQHIRIRHEEKSFACTECDYKTRYAHLLKEHTMSKHTNERPFACKKCDFRTVNAQNLKKHVAAKHTKLKPYPCNECSYRAARPQHLKIHIISQHLKEKKFLCTQCPYGSVQKCHVTKHMIVKHHRAANWNDSTK